MKQTRPVVLAVVILLLPLLASAQQMQIESVAGHEAAAHEALFKLQPWAASITQVVQPYDVDTVQQIGRSGFIRLRSLSLAADALVTALKLDPQIAFAEPNYIIHSTDTVPSDPDFSSLWGLQNTGQIVVGQ